MLLNHLLTRELLVLSSTLMKHSSLCSNGIPSEVSILIFVESLILLLLYRLLLLLLHLHLHLLKLLLLLCGHWLVTFLLDLLREVWKLISHSHTVKAVNITPMTHGVMRVYKAIVHWLLRLILLLLLFLHRLLLCKLVLEHLVVFSCVEFYLRLCFQVQIRFYWVICYEMLVSLWELPTLVNHHLNLIKISSKILGGKLGASPP